MIDRICTTKNKYGIEVKATVFYTSGCIRNYRIVAGYNTLPNTAKQFIKNSYTYSLETGEKLYKLQHD